MKNKEILRRLGIITALGITAGSVGAFSTSIITHADENTAIEDEYNPEDDVITTKYGAYLPSEEELTAEEQELVNSIIEQLPSTNNQNIEEDIPNDVVSTFYGPAVSYTSKRNLIMKIKAVGALVGSGAAIVGGGIAISAIKNKKKYQKDTEKTK